jgi:3-phosphoshikimate 1-carboxyvinyltransferase
VTTQDILCIRAGHALHGTARVPGDKSISHRALILGMLAPGESRVRGWLAAGDTLATLDAVRALGVNVRREGDTLTFRGGALTPPDGPIDCRNAGTAMRLLAGALAGQPFASTLDGSEQLRRRPMRRITTPLEAMGADITSADGHAPLHIHPARLAGITYEPPVASAQVKSAVLLAGLFAEGETTVIEPGPSRDHTERMLAAMGADITVSSLRVTVRPPGGAPLGPLDLTVPGDLSSAAFLMAASAALPGSDVRIEEVGLNPTRTGVLDALRAMGAAMTVEDEAVEGGEPVGTVRVRGGELAGARIGGAMTVRAIDELPILAALATQCGGETMIADAAELRVKEVDRISLLAEELRKLGARIEERPDGMVIDGPARLCGAVVDSHGDHRLGMALAVAGLFADGETVVRGAGCIADSFPGFGAALAALGAEVG